MPDFYWPEFDDASDVWLPGNDDIIFSRLESFHQNHTDLKKAFEKYCAKHDFNQPLFELLQQGDPWWVVDSPEHSFIKDIAFDLLYKLWVTSINPLPGPTRSYSYTLRSGFAQSHEVREILVAYFGQLPVTKYSCERISSEYRSYCADQLLSGPEHSGDKSIIDAILNEPYFRELYDHYCVLQSGMHQVGDINISLTKRMYRFMEQNDMSVYIPWIYDNYFFPTEPVINRASYEYKVANHFMTDLCKTFAHEQLIKTWANMVQEFGVKWITDLPKYVSHAVHEHVLKGVLTDIMNTITQTDKPDIDACLEIVGYAKMLKGGRPLFWPFQTMLQDIILENPLLRQLRGSKKD